MIRTANINDLPAIQNCAEEAFAPYIASIGRKPAPMTDDFASLIEKSWLFVAVAVDGGLQGYVVCEPLTDTMHLENIAVGPNYRGKGIGGQLVKFCEDHAKANGFNTVELYTNEKMGDNIKMYVHLGYMEIDRRHDSGFDRVYFRKTL